MQSTTPAAPAELGPLLPGLGAALGSAVDAVAVNRVHQRVYSRILDCELRLRSGDERRVVVKLYDPSFGASRTELETLLTRDFELTSRLHRLFTDSPHLLVPTPLYYSPKDLAIVTAHMPGTQLQEKLEARARWFPDAASLRELRSDCRGCGEWLRAFQAATRDEREGAVDVAAMRRMVAERLEWCVDSADIPLDEAGRGRILAHVDRLAAALRPGDLQAAAVHGDFFPGNILVDGAKVVGLDFVMSRAGSIYADPSYFVFQLETLAHKPRYRRDVVRSLQTAFLEGYNPDLIRADFFSSHPMLGLYCVFHYVMRLAGIFALKNLPLHRKVYNRFVSSAVIRRLLRLADGGLV